MSAHRLTRDDGVQCLVLETAWEVALELAYFYGWKPAGTEAPEGDDWRKRRASSASPMWDRQDYFSHQSQHVGREDASAMARGVSRALQDLADGVGDRGDGWSSLRDAAPSGRMPSRAAAMADGLSVTKKNAMTRLVAFASYGGFTIDGAP